MSRWKHLENWEQKLDQMNIEELRAELAFWKKRATIFGKRPAGKLTMKTVHHVEAVIRRKLRDTAEKTDQ